MSIRAIRVLALLLTLVLPFGAARARTPRVVASIVPIHALVSGVMRGIAEPALIVDGYASPHTFRMKPSTVTRLHHADVVFWVGAPMESFLIKPLASIARSTRVVTLMDIDGLRVYPNSAAIPHRVAEPVQSAAAPDDSGIDPHVWLDPRNARRMVDAIVRTLTDADPAHAPAYQANGKALGKRLAALDSELEARLAPVAQTPFIVFHDAYQYLVRRYDLDAAGAITLNPERAPSARRLRKVRDMLIRGEVLCAFADAQSSAAALRAVLDGTAARLGELDPVGATLEPSPDAYFQMMRANAQALIDCLAP